MQENIYLKACSYFQRPRSPSHMSFSSFSKTLTLLNLAFMKKMKKQTHDSDVKFPWTNPTANGRCENVFYIFSLQVYCAIILSEAGTCASHLPTPALNAHSCQM